MKNKKSISYRIFSKKNLKMAEEKTNLLGVNNKLDAVDLLNIRLFISVVVFISILYFIDFGYFIAPLVSFLVYQLFFPIVVDTKIEKRRKILEKDSLYFFEILVLSLEAGRNIKTAIEVTTLNIDSELSDEFKKVIKDVNYGKDLDSALEELKYRIPSDTVNNIILNIRQSNMFGNNIIETVYSQIAYIREKRLLETKAFISKIPIKISVVSVIFFIPLLLLLLLGPLIIELL
ncbi:MAG: type II secretion system F family protein [Bacilli bacterium]